MHTWIIPQFGFEHMQRAEQPEPTPGPGEVQVRVRAVSLNYRDLLIVKGHYNPRMKLPRVPLSDAAGQVVALGSGVTRVQIGQRVAMQFMPRWLSGTIADANARPTFGADIDGFATEAVVVSQDACVAIPDYLTWEEAASLPCAAVTAWNALMEGGLQAGETVLIQGTGGVSLFALQIAKMVGASPFVISGSDAKLERALALGATAGVNYRTTADWDQWVKAQTGGVDHIVEVGGAGTLERSFRAVRTGGHIALIGVLAGGQQVNPMPIIMKALRVRGIFVGSRAMFEALLRAFALHRIHPVVDRVFPMVELPQVLHYLEGAGHFGKVVLQA